MRNKKKTLKVNKEVTKSLTFIRENKAINARKETISFNKRKIILFKGIKIFLLIHIIKVLSQT